MTAVKPLAEVLKEGQDKVARLPPLIGDALHRQIYENPEVFRAAHLAEIIAALKGWTVGKMSNHDDLVFLNLRFKELETALFGEESEK